MNVAEDPSDSFEPTGSEVKGRDDAEMTQESTAALAHSTSAQGAHLVEVPVCEEVDDEMDGGDDSSAEGDDPECEDESRGNDPNLSYDAACDNERTDDIYDRDVSIDVEDDITNWGAFLAEAEDELMADDANIEPTESIARCTSGSIQTLTSLRRRLHCVAQWSSLLSILCLDGNTVFSEKQYAVLSTAIGTASGGKALACPRSMRNTIRKTLLTHCYPRSSISYICDNVRANRFTDGPSHSVPSDVSSREAKDCVRLILPTEWAKMDVISLPFYNAVFNDSGDVKQGQVDVEYTAVVHDRAEVLRDKPGIRAYLRDSYSSVATHHGEEIMIPCSNDPSSDARPLRGWNILRSPQHVTGAGRVSISGLVGPTVGVGMEGTWATVNAVREESDIGDD